mmetsp:Transcript_18825/g.47879  ORF Transcript_18825/g.47879 Transcript_18825/m.47879 type:complete len:218 (-) Transcript_18825:150-803(-)|eukprot:CAMPEP_0177639904 /NCGR_PEP_ID=MMETSP0447-20121125/6264_1 /TAXON_ID=0 /ORGANISM="Stygamoeba regulata, Strain BSH-02190019" /LENGTH=217 /DNA_ID=CAMNT_0019141951 /DNA_START=102 /DNA_END=755 /DNA_ORIENTATION=-
MSESAELSKSTDAPKSSLYTRTGDKGTSVLYNGERRSKGDLVYSALGNCDELSSHIGVAREYCRVEQNGLEPLLEEIQSRLLDMGSSIATPRDSSSEKKLAATAFSDSHVKLVEKWIDNMDSRLPKLTEFILPSGGLSSCFLHVCRSTCRRAERSIAPLLQAGAVEDSVGIYINRLSDFFFAAARYAAMKHGDNETRYKKATGAHVEKLQDHFRGEQ